MQRVLTAAPVERRFSTAEYYRMAEAGLFVNRRVIVTPSRRNNAAAVAKVAELTAAALSSV